MEQGMPRRLSREARTAQNAVGFGNWDGAHLFGVLGAWHLQFRWSLHAHCRRILGNQSQSYCAGRHRNAWSRWKLILEAVSVALAIGSPFCCRGGSSESPSWPAIARSGCYFRSDVASFAYRRNHVLGCASGTPTREYNRGRLVGGAKLCVGYNRVGVCANVFCRATTCFPYRWKPLPCSGRNSAGSHWRWRVCWPCRIG